MGLNPSDVVCHQKKIKESLKDNSQQFLEVVDTCRLDNGGILPLDLFNAPSDSSGFVGFVPSAGAASRYFQDIRPLEFALKDGEVEKIEREITRLKEMGAQTWALPNALKKVLSSSGGYALENYTEISEALNKPKALQPCVSEGDSYLRLKQREHIALGLAGEVYITPPHMSNTFKDHLLTSDLLPTSFLEQGPALSTLRFTLDGEPYRKKDGSYSPVPAGHGTLVSLFPEVKKLYSNCHSILIRNIDNVNGTSPQIIEDTKLFLGFHHTLLSRIKSIRALLKDEKFVEAAATAQTMLETRACPQLENYHSFLDDLPPPLQTLFEVQIKFFQFNPNHLNLFGKETPDKIIRKLFNRPVNTLGQVPNSGRDVGGTPVIAKVPGGKATICLEVPHASPEDRDMFLSNPDKATHFNPVFVAAELTDRFDQYQIDDNPFWILAHKKVGMTPVVYHETVLYELLGNSIMANTVFPAIPRPLFNPHKTAADTASKDLKDWLVES